MGAGSWLGCKMHQKDSGRGLPWGSCWRLASATGAGLLGKLCRGKG